MINVSALSRTLTLTRRQTENYLSGKKSSRSYKGRPVSINSHVYDDIAAAAKALNLPASTVTYRVNARTFRKWKYLVPEKSL